MSAIGVDIGSSRTVIAAIIKGGVEILLNESSYRSTKNMVGYGKSERLLGDIAYSKLKRNYKNTPALFTRLLNLEFGSEEFQKERKHLYTKMTSGDHNLACYKVKHQGKNLVLNPVQVLASHFNKILDVLATNNLKKQREMVVTIPGYLTIPERQSILAAGEIAGVKIVGLVEESECNVKNYGIFRRKDLTDEPRTVAFVDFGHSKSSIYFADVCKTKAKILYEENLRHLGGRDLDLELYQHFKQQFEEQTDLDIDENPKSKLKLMQAIEKVRMILSANSDANLNIEFLMEEEDFNTSITRDDFEKLGSHLFGTFREFIRGALKNSGIKPQSLHSVEILGGASRIKKIQQIIIEELKQKEVSKTLDLAESCARGAAIGAAERSPNFQVAKFAVNSINKYTIKCHYDMFKKSEGAIKTLTGTLFKKGCKLPSTMSVSVGKTPQSMLEVFYDDPVPARANQQIFKIVTDQINPKEPDHKLILRAVLNEGGIPYFKGADLEEYYVEEIKKKIEKKMEEEKPAEKKEGEEEGMQEEKQEEEPEYEIKKVKKTRITKINWNNLTPPLFSEKDITQFKKIESDMLQSDNLIKATNKARNDLETRIYAVKDLTIGKWAIYINPDEKVQIESKASELEEWLYEDGAHTTKDVYDQKLAILNSLCDGVEQRTANHQSFEQSVNYLNSKIHQYTGQIEKDVSFMDKCLNFLHIKVRFFSNQFP